MANQFLEAGQIVNTHGVRGEVKIVPWCDTPEFLCGFSTLYMDGKPISVRLKPAGRNIIGAIDGVDDVPGAMRYKGKILFLNRADVQLPEGRHFIADLIGLEVRDEETGAVLGKLTEVFDTPAHSVYVVQGEKTYMIPAVDAFLKKTDVAGGYLLVRLIEGMDG